MKNLKKVTFLLIVLLMALIFIPSFSNAATEVSDEDSLIAAIENPDTDNTISLKGNIQLTKPIGIVDKNITINGNGFTISANSESWVPAGDNSTLITAGSGAKVTLSNLKLKDAVKYGVQAYNGGHIVLDDVTISNCKYGAVLVNAGTVEVKDLHLGRNGGESNNGIEIAKGRSISTGDNEPTLIMNGTLTSTEKDNVVYIAINDELTSFEIQNTEDTLNKILSNGNMVVITDENNNILYKSNEVDDIPIEGETFEENITITIKLNDKSVTMSVPVDTTLTEEDVTGIIDLEALELSNYTIEGFYADKEYKKAFDFKTAITENTTIYAKLKAVESQTPAPTPQKDVTPKTGIENTLGIAVFILSTSVVLSFILKRKVK